MQSRVVGSPYYARHGRRQASSPTTRCCAACSASGVIGARPARARCSMQAAHPVAFAGFFAHTGALDEPYERLQRTAQVMNSSPSARAPRPTALTRRVRAMHRRVRGELAEAAGRFPAGTPYAADDPELLLWILAALADSAMLVYRKYVALARRRDERDALWHDYRVVGRLFGLRDARHARRHRRLRGLHGRDVAGEDLHVTPQARELAIEIVMRPPVPLQLRPLRRAGQPDHRRPAARRASAAQYGFSLGPGARGRAARRRRVRQARARAAAARARDDDPGRTRRLSKRRCGYLWRGDARAPATAPARGGEDRCAARQRGRRLPLRAAGPRRGRGRAGRCRGPGLWRSVRAAARARICARRSRSAASASSGA